MSSPTIVGPPQGEEEAQDRLTSSANMLVGPSTERWVVIGGDGRQWELLATTYGIITVT